MRSSLSLSAEACKTRDLDALLAEMGRYEWPASKTYTVGQIVVGVVWSVVGMPFRALTWFVGGLREGF